jgi:hypothetical protein
LDKLKRVELVDEYTLEDGVLDSDLFNRMSSEAQILLILLVSSPDDARDLWDSGMFQEFVKCMIIELIDCRRRERKLSTRRCVLGKALLELQNFLKKVDNFLGFCGIMGGKGRIGANLKPLSALADRLQKRRITMAKANSDRVSMKDLREIAKAVGVRSVGRKKAEVVEECMDAIETGYSDGKYTDEDSVVGWYNKMLSDEEPEEKPSKEEVKAAKKKKATQRKVKKDKPKRAAAGSAKTDAVLEAVKANAKNGISRSDLMEKTGLTRSDINNAVWRLGPTQQGVIKTKSRGIYIPA